MFFPERIRNIDTNDKVLEVGPGATPFHRSDVFLEKKYESEKEYIAQTGHVGKLSTSKQVVFFNGGSFPFEDNEFDYVICSHVLEHVENADSFLSEIQRVARKGYLEYPTIYYDYLYNFPEHTLFLMNQEGIINWMPKEKSPLQAFSPVQAFFYETSRKKYKSLINELKNYLFQGFEWENIINSKQVENLNEVCYDLNTFQIEENKLKPNQIIVPNLSLMQHLKHSLRKAFSM